MKRIISTFVAIIIAVSLQAQDFENTTKISETDYAMNEFGAHAGATTGIGLSYRHWFDKTGVQLTFLPFKSSSTEFYSAGLSGLYSVNRSKYVHVFAYLGSHLAALDGDININIGAGPGFAFGKVVTFNLQIGYGVYFSEEIYQILPSGEIGLYYRF
jgi:hypothetical protein